jgi:hypothetical protein
MLVEMAEVLAVSSPRATTEPRARATATEPIPRACLEAGRGHLGEGEHEHEVEEHDRRDAMIPLYGEVTHIAKLSTTSWNTRQGAERDLGVELRGHDTDGPVAAAGHRGLDELVEHQPVGDAGSVAAERMMTRAGEVPAWLPWRR